jgi:hypothetical protein
MCPEDQIFYTGFKSQNVKQCPILKSSQGPIAVMLYSYRSCTNKQVIKMCILNLESPMLAAKGLSMGMYEMCPKKLL